jgi:hypothetical protein
MITCARQTCQINKGIQTMPHQPYSTRPAPRLPFILLMEDPPPNYCIDCKKSWETVTQARRALNTVAGKKGDPLPRCEACQAKRNGTDNRRKRKNKDKEPPEDIPTSQDVSYLDPATFEEELRSLATQDWTTFSATVHGFWKEGEDPKVCALRIADVIYDCLGYKFR